jgi:hypothetical protein
MTIVEMLFKCCVFFQYNRVEGGIMETDFAFGFLRVFRFH